MRKVCLDTGVISAVSAAGPKESGVCANVTGENRERARGDDYFSFSSFTLCCCAFAEENTVLLFKNNKIYFYVKFHSIH